MIDIGSVSLLKDVPAENAKLVEERKRDEERARGWLAMEGGLHTFDYDDSVVHMILNITMQHYSSVDRPSLCLTSNPIGSNLSLSLLHRSQRSLLLRHTVHTCLTPPL